ncbi:MAG: hypothetical protein ACKO6O_08850 [Acidimicrobiaceae bacterium]
MGMKDSKIILRHIVPNVLPALIAVAFLQWVSSLLPKRRFQFWVLAYPTVRVGEA